MKKLTKRSSLTLFLNVNPTSKLTFMKNFSQPSMLHNSLYLSSLSYQLARMAILDAIHLGNLLDRRRTVIVGKIQ